MTTTRNIKLTIEYDGSKYFGFQYQKEPELPTVQLALENALLELTKQKHSVIVAGRTDRGVHARAQVCNFLTDCKYPLIVVNLSFSSCEILKFLSGLISSIILLNGFDCSLMKELTPTLINFDMVAKS